MGLEPTLQWNRILSSVRLPITPWVHISDRAEELEPPPQKNPKTPDLQSGPKMGQVGIEPTPADFQSAAST